MRNKHLPKLLVGAFLWLACDQNNIIGVVEDAGMADAVTLPDVAESKPPLTTLGPTGTLCGTEGGGAVVQMRSATEAPILVVAYASSRIAVYDAVTGRLVRALDGMLTPAQSLTVSDDGKRVAAAASGLFKVWEVDSGRVVLQGRTGALPDADLGFSKDGRRIFTANRDGTLQMWNESGSKVWQVAEGYETVSAVYHSGSETVIFTSSRRSQQDIARAIVRSAIDGSLVRQLRLAVFFSTISDVTPDGQYWVGWAPDRPFVWKSSDGSLAWNRQLRGVALALSADGSTMVITTTASVASNEPLPTETTLLLLDVQTGAQTGSLTVPYHATHAAFTAVQDTLAVANEWGEVQILSIENAQSAVNIPVPLGVKKALSSTGINEPMNSVAIAPGGDAFAVAGTGYGEHSVNLWRYSSGISSPVRTIVGEPGSFSSIPSLRSANAVSFSPDGTKIAMVLDYPGAVHIANASTGAPITQFGKGMVTTSYSPDGQHVASSCNCLQSGQPAVRLWYASSGQPAGGMGDTETSVFALSYSPNGKHLAVVAAGGNAGSVGAMDVATNRFVWRSGPNRGGNPEYIRGSLAYSSDGRWLAFKDLDPRGSGEVFVFDAATGTELRRLSIAGGNDGAEGNSYSAGGVGFSSDGMLLATGARKGILVWRTSDWIPFEPIEMAAQGVAFFPNSDRLVAGGLDGSVRHWCGIGKPR